MRTECILPVRRSADEQSEFPVCPEQVEQDLREEDSSQDGEVATTLSSAIIEIQSVR